MMLARFFSILAIVPASVYLCLDLAAPQTSQAAQALPNIIAAGLISLAILESRDSGRREETAESN